MISISYAILCVVLSFIVGYIMGREDERRKE